MKSITLSAVEHLIELAREEGRARKTTLNAMFREWLEEISRGDQRRKKAEESFSGCRNSTPAVHSPGTN